jgi:pantetheine-phosphate adenylyltransferase
MTKKNIGIYPGTFDPITNGHADIIARASKLTDTLILGVSENAGKNPMFSIDERCEMARIYLNKYDIASNVEVMKFDGLLTKFASQVNAKFIVRGLRAVSDFEYEFQMACMNSRLDETIETIFLPASEKNQFISSRLVKEIVSMEGDISGFVIPEIEQRLIKFFKDKK